MDNDKDDKNCFKNKTGLLEAKECGTIFWNEYQEDLFMVSCKFCNKWFKIIDEFFKHVQIHRKTIEIDNLHKIKEEIEFIEIHNYDDEVYNVIPCNEKTLDIAPQETQNLDIELQDNSGLTDILDSCSQNNKIQLQQLQKQSDQKNLKCKLCYRILGTSTRRKQHEQIHSGENSYKCQHCSESFRTSRIRNDHGKKCASTGKIEEHIEVNDKISDFELKKVIKNNQNECDTNIDNDKEDIIKQDNKICRFCGQFFATRARKKEHERLHTGETPYSCQFCSANFRTNRTRKSHCEVCMENPNRISKEHTKVYECDRCHIKFRNKSNLNVHKRRHDGIKKYTCSYCEKRFISTTERRIHERSHTGCRPYLCITCGKSFSTSSHLNEHIKIHKSEKLHKCQICGKEFHSSTKLKNHIKTHSNHKPFKCEACDAAFTTNNGRRAHKKLHDEVGKYLCTICNKIFKQYSGLYSHLKIHKVEKLKEHIHKTN